MDLPKLASIPSRFNQMLLPAERTSSFLPAKTFNVPRPTQCNALSRKVSNNSQTITRRSADFQRSIWHYDYIQSLSSAYKEEEYMKQRAGLKEEVRMMLCEAANKLELIDIIQRLGVSHHFNDEISNILENVYNKMDTFKSNKNLYETSLQFRLLRQHGYNVSTDVFDSFCDKMGSFKKSQCDEVKGMLSLYEASFVALTEESIMNEAKDFSLKFLKEYKSKNKGDQYTSLLINHALEIPLHWRLPIWEARWFINAYETSPNMCPALLEFAKLDFNMIQAIQQEDLKDTSRWWETIGLVDKLSFCRDRLVECFFFGAGTNFKPDLGYFGRVSTKVNCLITIIDDIYDVYGTLEELELFTEAIDRWDLNAVEALPEYMKICFLALYNFVNEMALETLKENGILVIPYLKKSWIDLCKSYLREAKWYHSGYTPTFGEYVENAWVSIGAAVMLVHAYFALPNPSRNEDLGDLEEYPDIIRLSSVLLRLVNDLGSSKGERKTGDVPKAVACYMNEYGGSEADAREHVMSIIGSTWKMMDKEVCNSTFNQDFLDIAVNLPRVALFFYENEEGFTVQAPEIKNRMSSLIMKPIPM